uniref:HTH CENPB-type domain-containing protein n=1 Tax=Anopheles minimus TaxID=112268 RepID=A0A182VQY8_9DIPT
MLEFGLPLSSYYKIISNKDTTKQQCLQGKGNVRRNRSAEFPNVERCLLHWISQRIDRGLPLEGPAIKEKAKLFSVKLGINDFSASNGWLDGFKKRQGLIFSRSQHGETEKADSTVGKHGTDVTDCFTNLLDEYEANDIYSITETGLFYKCTPDQIANYREKDCREGENAQERLTVLLCANLTGTDKLPILVIGQPDRSECLKEKDDHILAYETNWDKLALHEPKASFSDYVQVDENVAITALFTDDDILEM